MENDITYIKEVLAGKTATYAKLVDKYQGYVYSVVLRILKNREEAEEAAQDVFVKAFRRLHSYNRMAKFSTWLYRIAYNTAIDYSRKKKHDTASIDDDESFLSIPDKNSRGQFEQLQAVQRSYYINQMVNQLPEKEGILVTLFYLKENSVEEIAKITNLSVSNVKVKLFRIRKRLKKDLENILHNEAKELL